MHGVKEADMGATTIKAAILPPTHFEPTHANAFCQDFVDGFCRHGDFCSRSHTLVPFKNRETPAVGVRCQENYLSLEPRSGTNAFDEDGPGALSILGPRHDNDHINISEIRILPTTDEIFSIRAPYMPSRDPDGANHLPPGQQRLLDTNFRQLRFENTEVLIDCCYHASQELFRARNTQSTTNSESRRSTSSGSQYYLYKEIIFEEVQFDEGKGVMFRVSFACPTHLRGKMLGMSKILEEGMLVALVGLEGDSISTTFMEVHVRQSTAAMRNRTGNDLRGKTLYR